MCACAALESVLREPFRNVQKSVSAVSRDLTETSGPCRSDFGSRLHPVQGRNVWDWVRSGALDPLYNCSLLSRDGPGGNLSVLWSSKQYLPAMELSSQAMRMCIFGIGLVVNSRMLKSFFRGEVPLTL